jgi:pyruvate formate lyase activating enzyme
LFNCIQIEKINELLKYTDLILLDIKHIDDEKHKELTSHSNKNVLDFARYLSEKNIPIWVRHVVVPTITDNEEDLKNLGKFLATLNNIKALDVLPYHNMAIPKYENLKMDYKLKNLPILSKEEAIKARTIILNAYKQAK